MKKLIVKTSQILTGASTAVVLFAGRVMASGMADLKNPAQAGAEMARGKVIEERPVFAVIQPASVPLRPENSRAKVLIIWTFLGFALSTAWVLYGKEYWEKAKTIFKEIKNQ